MNLALLHEALATAYPDRECIVTPSRRLTYGEVSTRARRLANLLLAHGLGCHRERSALANYESGQDHVGRYLLDDADAAGLIYHARYAPVLARIRAQLPKLRLLLQVEDDSGEALLPG